MFSRTLQFRSTLNQLLIAHAIINGEEGETDCRPLTFFPFVFLARSAYSHAIKKSILVKRPSVNSQELNSSDGSCSPELLDRSFVNRLYADPKLFIGSMHLHSHLVIPTDRPILNDEVPFVCHSA